MGLSYFEEKIINVVKIPIPIDVGLINALASDMKSTSPSNRCRDAGNKLEIDVTTPIITTYFSAFVKLFGNAQSNRFNKYGNPNVRITINEE